MARHNADTRFGTWFHVLSADVALLDHFVLSGMAERGLGLPLPVDKCRWLSDCSSCVIPVDRTKVCSVRA